MIQVVVDMLGEYKKKIGLWTKDQRQVQRLKNEAKCWLCARGIVVKPTLRNI